MHKRILGLDIGGANLKAAHTDGLAHTKAFALWRHPDGLTKELTQLASVLPAFDEVAVTMTGELCDCFATKREGVDAIVKSVREAFPHSRIVFWSIGGGFVDFDAARIEPLQLAAANWLASAHLVGKLFPRENALFVDAGSTTTDILFIRKGLPEPRGFTDSERLASSELVYTGVRRTPICALVDGVAAEFFATIDDAYLLLGSIPERPGDTDTADGRDATVIHAHARMSRMICGDGESVSASTAQNLARQALEIQWSRVSSAIDRVCAARPAVERVVIAGSGEILARSAIARSHQNAAPITPLSDVLGPSLSVAACAYAVALLAAEADEPSDL